MPDPRTFMTEWIGAWNAHDLEAILSHYADDAVFLSPRALEVTGEGRVTGKEALRAYWARGLALRPDLHFSEARAFAGFDALTIAYVGAGGRNVTETFEFGVDDLVVRACACYAL